MNTKFSLVLAASLALSGCGGGDWEEECRAKGGTILQTPEHDNQCLIVNPLPDLDRRQGG